jgi:AcrR family transcriptional regulator
MNRVIQKHELVGIAADLFRMKGYAGTSIDDIARACGLTKGSLYHHFSGKEELALAALEQVHQYYREHIFALILDADRPGPAELQAFNGAIEAFFARHPHGCLLANLSMEGGQAAEPFGRAIGRFFDEWLACYLKVFERGYPPAEARARAEDALAVVHGCVLMNRIRANLQPLQRQHAELVRSCRSALAA